jgi:hypothetical protein
MMIDVGNNEAYEVLYTSYGGAVLDSMDDLDDMEDMD